jgi:SAM-dependent methyltransferase
LREELETRDQEDAGAGMSRRMKKYRDAAHSGDRPAPDMNESNQPMDAGRDALTRRLAERFCNQNDLECGWYHGEWELLKSLGIVSSAAVHTHQLQALLQMALEGLPQRPRILLSGSTDDSLLRIVSEGVGTRIVDVVALDICATPLELMRAYATSRELHFDSIRADILEYEDQQGYDLILTHAFMGNFADRDRARLVARWYALLRSGGRVATIQRVRPQGTPTVIGFSAEQTEAFVQAALESGAKHGLEDVSQVERVARAFTQKKRTYSITSHADFELLFTAAGFKLINLQYNALPTLPGLSGPSVPSGGKYAFLIAGKDTVIQ